MFHRQSNRIAPVAALCLLLGLTSCPRVSKGPDLSDPKALRAAARDAERTGRFARAEQLWLRVLRGARRQGDARQRFRATLALSRVTLALGRPAVGRALLQNELILAKRHRKNPQLAEAHAALGDLHFGAGELGSAAEQYKWAALYAWSSEIRSLRARVASRQAVLAARQGDFAEARKAMARVMGFLAGLKAEAAARAALAAGQGFAALSDHRRAKHYLSLAQGELGGKALWAESAEALLGLARLARAVGDRRLARADFRRALSQLSEAGFVRRHALAAWSFSRALEAWGEPRRAAAQRQVARAGLRKLGDRYGEARLDLEWARALQRRRRHRDAAGRLQKAVAALERAGDRFSAGQARIRLGRARTQLGQAAEALGELTRALDHAAAVRAPELSWQAYALLGRISDTLLDAEDKAARFHRGAVNGLERVRAGLDLIGGADAAAEDNAYYELARIHIKQWRRGGDPKHFDAALAALERSRSRRLLDLLTRVGASLADTEQERVRVRRLSGQERLLAERLAEPGHGLALRRLLYARLRSIRARRARSEKQALRFAAAHPAPVSVAILKAALTGKDALLIYHVGRRSSLLLAFNNERSLAVNLPGRARLARAVARYVDPLFARRSLPVAQLRRLGAALHKALVAPVSGLLAGRTRVQLVLTGPLWRLPFAALPVGKAGWLGQSRAFVRIPSPAVWLKLRGTPRGQSATRELLAVARVTGDVQGARSPVRSALRARGHALARLPGARKRAARMVARLGAGQGTIWSAGRGSEAALFSRKLTPFRRVHFGAKLLLPAKVRGMVQPALVLAGDARRDGLLLLRELLGLALDADLVSVEGLERGRKAPDWAAQEGFARALLLAGARSVVLPLTAPSPVASERFFSTLYPALVKPTDKATAWRAAQRAVQRDRRTAHPRHFASYVLYGAW